MEVTLIDKSNLKYFRPLLLPSSVQKLEQELPVVAIGAVDKGIAVGALAGGPLGGIFNIESLFVASSCRGRGAGTALLAELVRVCQLQENISELSCDFLISCEDHEKLAAFLRAQGFSLENAEDTTVAIPLDELTRLSFYKTAQASCRVYTLEDLPENLLRGLDKRLMADSGPVLEQPLTQAPLDHFCSTVTVKNAAIDACLLIEKKGERLISLSYADAGSSIGSGSVFTSLLITSFRNASKKYPVGTRVLIQPVTPLSQALVGRLAPNARRVGYAAIRMIPRAKPVEKPAV